MLGRCPCPSARRNTMNARLAGTLPALCYLCSRSSPAHGDEADAKPVKKTIRADDGVSLVCEFRGRGDTALVFLHGWCGDRAYWKNQAEAFANDYRVVTLDQAGHG